MPVKAPGVRHVPITRPTPQVPELHKLELNSSQPTLDPAGSVNIERYILVC